MSQREITIEQRIKIWLEEFKNHFYEPIEEVVFEAHFTKEMLTYQEAMKKEFYPIHTGDGWGEKWEYGWFRTTIQLPNQGENESIYFIPGIGGEMLVYVNGKEAGSVDLQHDGIMLTHSGRTGDTYTIVMESYAGHGPRLEHGGPAVPERVVIPEPPKYQVKVKPSTYGIWNKKVFDLYMDADTLYKLYLSLDTKSLRKQKIKEGLFEFTKVIDFEEPKEVRFPYKEAKEILEPLLSCKNGSTAPLFTIFGQSHLDLAWKWPWAETRRKCGRTLSTQMAFMEEYEDYKFLLCEPVITESIKKDYPDLYERIIDKFAQGQIIPEGGMWVEPDTNIPSGESLIRQCIYGRQWFLEEFRIETKMVWLPDCFGFSGQLPQIMIGCKMKYFSTQKLARALEGHDKFPYNHFYWEGIDGSRILTHFFKKNNSRYDPYQLNERWEKDRVQEENIDTFIFPFGYGDGGGGATRDMLESVKRTKDLEGTPRTKMESPIAFFERLEKSNVKNTYSGEIYLPWHRGTYTAESRIKKANRKAEYALRDLEIAMTLWSIADSSDKLLINDYNKKIRELWEILLFNHFHDIIAGTSITRVHEEALNELTYVEEEALRVKNLLLDSMAEDKKGISILNTLSWNRKELVLLPEFIDRPCDDKGEEIPVHLTREGKYCMVSVPSFGTTPIYNKVDGQGLIAPNFVVATRNSMENEDIRLEFDSCGQITSILHKKSQIQFAESLCNKFRMFKDVNIEYDAWEMSPYYEEMEVALEETGHIEVVEECGLFATIRITKSLHHSTMTQDITMYAGSNRVDFKTKIDWKETHKLLKVEFPVAVRAREAYEEIQFGYVKRPTHKSTNYDGDRFEVCNHKYTALSESNRTFAILNDCKYGVSTNENKIALTLLRAPVIPDMYSDQGIHEFTYSIYLDDCSFYESDVIKEGYCLNVPVTVFNRVVERKSFIKLSHKDVIIETVKLAEDNSNDMIVRLYESKGGHCSCNLDIDYYAQAVCEVMMTEEIEEASSVLPMSYEDGRTSTQLSFRPFEIKTIRIR